MGLLRRISAILDRPSKTVMIDLRKEVYILRRRAFALEMYMLKKVLDARTKSKEDD